MTQEEFDRTRFGKDTRVKHKDGYDYHVVSVDFEERLLCVSMKPLDLSTRDTEFWVRCENVDLVEDTP